MEKMHLKDFIKENYEEFNNEEPSAKHLERFEQRLKQQKLQKRKVVIFNFVAAAAVFAGLLIALIVIENYGKNGSQTVCVLSDEMRETKNYYQSVVKSETEKIRELLENAEPEIRQEIMDDIKEITGDSMDKFCNNSEEGMAIMVQYYQEQIQTLQNISGIFENK